MLGGARVGTWIYPPSFGATSGEAAKLANHEVGIRSATPWRREYLGEKGREPGSCKPMSSVVLGGRAVMVLVAMVLRKLIHSTNT